MTTTSDLAAPLFRRLCEAPIALPGNNANAELETIREQVGARPSLAAPAVADLLAGILSGSPYLSTLIRRDGLRVVRLLETAPEKHFADLTDDLKCSMAGSASMPDAMRALRVFKAEVALLVALADLGGVWDVMEAARALTQAADAALGAAVSFLFRQAAVNGDWKPRDEAALEQGSGFIVLAMGKYGAGELNYSSDIDLIVFYEADDGRLRPDLEPATFFVRLTRDLVRLLQERTSDGYVFRVDLRLRPDAGATQVALSTDTAFEYYESFGQNWERAALIKARPAAGDIGAGERFLAGLAPFVWRRALDFAAIADIHAMKRQIHAYHGFGVATVPGHNIKLGSGGIREIEFFVQTQQLIAGGRQPALRVRATTEALNRLAGAGWIAGDVAQDLERDYRFLRRIEHRLQMVADEQTHEIPDDPHRLETFARFAGFEPQAFPAALLAVLGNVQKHYAALFEASPVLTVAGVSMVFAGEADDPATVAALKDMGYANPVQVLATVRGWHHGHSRAVRSAAARERLTEVQPRLIAALAETADPDGALVSFDRFLTDLPAGVQLFSLLRANPALIRLLADIMGTAPRLAQILSRRRRLFDAVIDPRAFAALPDAEALDVLIAAGMEGAATLEEVLDRVRVVGSEQAFLIGLRLLAGSLGANQAGRAYALLAERLIAALQAEVERVMVAAHGRIAGGAASVLAMGKLGGREMTAASDLDLILVYDFDAAAQASDGPRPLAPTHYYTRLTQRLIAALSAPTAEGSLYEVDMRLRPSGQKGPVATQFSSFVIYQAEEAWTWEHMALTRARVITGPQALRAKVEAAIKAALVKPRDRDKTAADVRDMRARIVAEKGTDRLWDLKQVRGGLVDLEFIAQYLQLIYAAAHPSVLDPSTTGALHKLVVAGVLDPAAGETLIEAARLLDDLTQILRLCLIEPFDPAKAAPGLRELLARAAAMPTFAALEARLRDSLAAVTGLFDDLIR